VRGAFFLPFPAFLALLQADIDRRRVLIEAPS
jgi:hypothetical protein